MKLPYGISDFRALREEGYLYIDKTSYIEKLENLSAKYLFFIRPRRFGKSLFLSTLSHYYDINQTNNFEKLFGDLYIGQNPTKLRNSYLILKLNFSGLNTDNEDRLENSFRLSLIDAIFDCLDRYKKYFDNGLEIKARIKDIEDIGAILSIFITAVKKLEQKVYLIIDEYDHFANDIIAMGESKFYKNIIRATGFVRDFYETVKIGTESVIDRIFITGISPIMLDDLTSGFNIASNLTMNPILNEMLGFTEDEVNRIISEFNMIDDKLSLVELKNNYNGYLFNHRGKKRVYNPDMVLYFFNQWQMTGFYPEDLIDENVKTDYGRLNRLVSNEENRWVLEEIILNEGIVADLVTKFSFDRMYDDEYFVSLLFYMGLLTIDRRERMRLFLKIPNYVVKTIFWEYIEKSLESRFEIRLSTNELRKSIENLAYDGQIKPYIDYISENVLKRLSNRDLQNFDEKYIKVILFSYLVDSKAYKPVSEREVEKGYIDIYLEKDLRMPDVEYEWIIELKYLKKSDRDKLDEVKAEGLKQLEDYARSKSFEDREKVKKVLLVFVGKEEYHLIEHWD